MHDRNHTDKWFERPKRRFTALSARAPGMMSPNPKIHRHPETACVTRRIPMIAFSDSVRADPAVAAFARGGALVRDRVVFQFAGTRSNESRRSFFRMGGSCCRHALVSGQLRGAPNAGRDSGCADRAPGLAVHSVVPGRHDHARLARPPENPTPPPSYFHSRYGICCGEAA